MAVASQAQQDQRTATTSKDKRSADGGRLNDAENNASNNEQEKDDHLPRISRATPSAEHKACQARTTGPGINLKVPPATTTTTDLRDLSHQP
jgi:hypothetical protein